MKIFVEPSDYLLTNRGDAAALGVALHRLGTLWPEATIQVLSEEPEELARLFPDTRPQSIDGHGRWNGHFIPTWMPASVSRPLRRPERILSAELRLRWPGLATSVVRRNTWGSTPTRSALDRYLEAVSSADLVVVTGMGGIADNFRGYAIGVLGTLALAKKAGVRTAMMSQQIGPVHSRRLRHLAHLTLPDVDLIALREEKVGNRILRELGVDMGRVVTTGDDTIEMVYARRNIEIGTGLGINLRRSGYAEVDGAVVGSVRDCVKVAAQKWGAPLIGLPISHRPGEDDAVTASELGAVEVRGYPALTDLDGFLERVRRCRTVVTGSYHGAVFALAQGIPAVGVTNSEYYDQKFDGLRGLFGAGCKVVSVSQPHFNRRLIEAMDDLWAGADILRDPLLDAAARLAEQGRAAYSRLFQLVGPAGLGSA